MQQPLILSILAAVLGLVLLIGILWESFETVVLPRSVTRGLRTTRLFYRITWHVTSWSARRFFPDSRRELFLSYYGPLSLPLLLSLWAACLIVGFALLQWAQGASAVNYPVAHRGLAPSFGTDIYTSGVTFFTLGYGDITPRTGLARSVAVIEAGVGFGFLALVISYLPVLYQAFSRREAMISRMDGRASSPSSCAELLRRHAQAGSMESLIPWLRDWEVWAADLLESHLSYPVLTYYRSQHDHQSWITALTTTLDTCALLIVGFQGETEPWQEALQWQARMTFAMARHAVIDLAYVFNMPPRTPDADRLPGADLVRLRAMLCAAGLNFCDGDEDDRKLEALRGLYEPYITSLASFLIYRLPAWQPDGEVQDNWQTSAWEHGLLNAQDLHFH
jgi:hypothetical protein